MKKLIWMAVTADKYELPMVVADSQKHLAKCLGVSPGTIMTKSWKYNHGIIQKKKKCGPKPKYYVVSVEEIDDEDEV